MRYFAVVVDVMGAQTANHAGTAERIVDFLTDHGASIEAALIRERACWSLEPALPLWEEALPDVPGQILRVQVPFTAPEFVDFGFEVLMSAVRLSLLWGALEMGVPAAGCFASLLWRDDERGPWQNADLSRGVQVDLDVKRLNRRWGGP